MQDLFDWIVQGRVMATRYPANEADLDALRLSGVRVIINLTDRPHDHATLHALGLTEIHLPVPDFTAPSPATLEAAIAGIAEAHKNDQAVAVHCLGGLGRTGTVVAAWLVSEGRDPDEAIAHVRACRPGSIETSAQEQSIRTFARTYRRANSGSSALP